MHQLLSAGLNNEHKMGGGRGLNKMGVIWKNKMYECEDKRGRDRIQIKGVDGGEKEEEEENQCEESFCEL